MKKTKFYQIVLYFFILAGILGVFYSATNSSSKNISFWNNSNTTSLTDWSFVDSSNNTTVIKKDLSDSNDNFNYICFITEDSFVEVYSDDILIYSFGNANDLPFGHSPGNAWNFVKIPNEYINSTITIKIMSPYEKFSGNLHDISIGTESGIIQHILRQSLPLVIISFIPIVFALLLLLLSPIVFKESKMVVFHNMAILMLFTSIWSLTNSGFLQFYFGNAFVIEIVGYICFSLLPAIAAVTLWELGIIKNKLIFQSMLLIDLISFSTICALQFFNIADFFNTIFYIHLVLLINAVFYLLEYWKKSIKNKFICLGIFIVFTAFNFTGNGFLFIYGMILFIIIISGWVVKKTLRLHYDNIEKDTYKKIAQTDDLTCLGNRRAFDECLKYKERIKEKILIVFIDLNCLKAVNDLKGHAFGDEYIIISSELLREFEKRNASCFRIGGDEFCVIGSEIDGDYADEVCSKINIELAKQKDLFGIKLSLSYGYSYYDPEKDVNIFHSLSRADANMYKFKKANT